MNPDIKAKWIAALRSGKYEQGRGQLKTHDGKYCCLGVLTDLWAKDRQTEFPSGCYLFAEVQDWADLHDPGGNPIVGDDWLANVNDTGAPFTEIADLIEQHL